jgi:isopenicillin N synthase-like dioxygenase
MGIPVISLAGDEATIARQVREACTTMGFFYVVDHGIPAAQVQGIFEGAARFFALPPTVKQAIGLHGNRGWEGIGAQTLDAGAKPDQKESFYSGIEHGPDHPYVKAGYHGYGRNFWPEGLPGFAEQMTAYTEAQVALCETLMRHLARSLDLRPDYFDASMGHPLATLRLCRYPPHPADATADTFGAGAHTDWGAITVLAQDSLGGLQVQAPDGGWIDATPLDGSFVVNLGDMIPRWTNGHYRSNLHRVINANPTQRDRYSIPFFYSPDYLARIEAVPGTVAPGEQPRHAACTAGEHLAEMYRKTYGLAA